MGQPSKMSTDDPRDDRDRGIMARARTRIDERHIEDRQARWWTWTIVVAGLLFAGWFYFAYQSEPTTASKPAAETMGRTGDAPTRPTLPAQPNGTPSPQMRDSRFASAWANRSVPASTRRSYLGCGSS
jgi:hypothetical protein